LYLPSTTHFTSAAHLPYPSPKQLSSKKEKGERGRQDRRKWEGKERVVEECGRKW